MTRIGLATIGVLAVVVASRLVAADQWPRFRGTQAGVAADDPALPDRWSETENIAWKIDIPGLAWSSPIVWNDHIFVTSAVSPGVEAAPEKGLYDPGDEHGKTRSTSVNRWIVHDVDFESGRIRWSPTGNTRK